MTDHDCTEEARITRNEKDIQDMWKIIESLRKGYLPLWATFLLITGERQMKHLCEQCNNCIPGKYADWTKWQYAHCKATESAELANIERVTSSDIPVCERYGYCQLKRTEDTCPDFVPLPYSTEAIDKEHRFDDEKDASILDMPELEEESCQQKE